MGLQSIFCLHVATNFFISLKSMVISNINLVGKTLRQAIPAQNGWGLPVPSFLYVVFEEEVI